MLNSQRKANYERLVTDTHTHTRTALKYHYSAPRYTTEIQPTLFSLSLRSRSDRRVRFRSLRNSRVPFCVCRFCMSILFEESSVQHTPKKRQTYHTFTHTNTHTHT